MKNELQFENPLYANGIIWKVDYRSSSKRMFFRSPLFNISVEIFKIVRHTLILVTDHPSMLYYGDCYRYLGEDMSKFYNSFLIYTSIVNLTTMIYNYFRRDTLAHKYRHIESYNEIKGDYDERCFGKKTEEKSKAQLKAQKRVIILEKIIGFYYYFVVIFIIFFHFIPTWLAKPPLHILVISPTISSVEVYFHLNTIFYIICYQAVNFYAIIQHIKIKMININDICKSILNEKN